MQRSEHPRLLALDALLRIEGGAYANLVLHEVLDDRLDTRDRGLVTELVNGVTRRRLALDHHLARLTSRPLAKLDPVARNALRLGAYQLIHTRMPPHAAVASAVEAAKARSHQGVVGLVNGVLRNLARELAEGPGRTPAEGPVTSSAERVERETGVPAHIVARWAAQRGEDDAAALARAADEPSPLVLRVNRLRTTPAALRDALVAAGIANEPSPVLPEALRLPAQTPLSRLPVASQGNWYVQGEGAMLAAAVVDPQPGEVVGDVGAAPGGKSTHLAERMGNVGRVIAVDSHPNRLELVAENAARLGATIVEPRLGDAREPWAEPGTLDRVLVDAPCSGLGVLARKADLRHRVDPAARPGLVATQRAMLDAAASALKPGGVLVYATCTIDVAENEQVAEAFLADHPGFAPSPVAPYLPEAWRSDAAGPDGCWVQLLPHRHGVEGFFLARFVKR